MQLGLVGGEREWGHGGWIVLDTMKMVFVMMINYDDDVCSHGGDMMMMGMMAMMKMIVAMMTVMTMMLTMMIVISVMMMMSVMMTVMAVMTMMLRCWR